MSNQKINLFYEVLLFFSLPLLFIFVYALRYHAPAHQITEHLYLVACFTTAAISLKLLISTLIHQKKLASILSASLYASLFAGILTYYTLVLIGLNSWRKVITIEFIISYAQQAQSFCQVLEISYELVIASLLLAFIAIFTFCYFLLKHFNWQPTQKFVSNWLFNLIILLTFLLSSFWAYNYLSSNRSSCKEPICTTLFSGANSSRPKLHSANQGNQTANKVNHLEELARKSYAPNPIAQKRNLVILLVDALRPDHMSLYGYPRDTTPYLKQLEKQNLTIKYTNAHSTCGETTCAHASLFGSRYIHKLPDKPFSLQEALMKHGYTTNFMISGNHTNFNGIREVYGKIDSYYDGSMQSKYYFNDDAIIMDKTEWLPEWDGKPVMFHYHILSTHLLSKKYGQFLKYKPAKNYAGKSTSVPDEKFTNFYDNGVLQTDFVIHTLLSTLKRKKYLENALVIVMADHGESLGEHGLISHANSVQEELLHIPLILIPYGYQSNIPAYSDKFTSVIDIAPTILHEFNMPIPDTWVGKPMYDTYSPQTSYFQIPPFRGLYDLTDPKNVIKYWINDNTQEEFAFNLSKDPNEMQNIFIGLPRERLDKIYALLPTPAH